MLGHSRANTATAIAVSGAAVAGAAVAVAGAAVAGACAAVAGVAVACCCWCCCCWWWCCCSLLLVLLLLSILLLLVVLLLLRLLLLLLVILLLLLLCCSCCSSSCSVVAGIALRARALVAVAVVVADAGLCIYVLNFFSKVLPKIEAQRPTLEDLNLPGAPRLPRSWAAQEVHESLPEALLNLMLLVPSRPERESLRRSPRGMQTEADPRSRGPAE